MTPRPWLAAVACLLLVGCGDPRYQQRTADEWAEQLLEPAPKKLQEAVDALRALSRDHRDSVLSALSARMRRPLPKAVASPFTVRTDDAAAKRLGLPPLSAADAAKAVLPTIKARLAALNAQPASVRATGAKETEREIDVVIASPRPRADVQRIQRLVVLRGAV